MSDAKKPAKQCCCNYGSAVAGEWPEFECYRCPKHEGGLAAPNEMCKRHAKEAAA